MSAEFALGTSVEAAAELPCHRTQPISGRWEGGSMQSGRAPLTRSVLDLRIDIDEARANSPVLNRVSADRFRLQPVALPFAAPSRVYLESWIVDAPTVRWARCQVEITGRIRWWRGVHPLTTVTIVVPWTSTSLGPATVRLVEAGGATSTYTCAKRSPSFRALDLEIDVCASVNAPPLLPSYRTDAHALRPAGLPVRTLTIPEAYREAGVGVTLAAAHTVIDDSAPAFASWTAAELHDAMEVHYSRFGQAWPAWRMWGLMAGTYVNSGVGGIMFDAAAGFGGAGQGPERQGFAVFRGHQWFDDLPAGAPANQDEAWALRHFLYTWVHEAGHAFNLLHSWDKNRASSVSWMNYDWRYDAINGTDSFWSNFRMRFDDEELLHIRHGDRSSVIMGGDSWASGGHLEGPPAASSAQLEGDAPLELLVRAPQYFELMEPVSIELRLRNLLPVPLTVDARLRPESGGVAVFVQRPDGRVVEYGPVLCELGVAEPRELAPAGAADGSDRYSESVFIAYGRDGFVFDAPGQYLVRALYQGAGDLLIPSNTLPLRVGVPRNHQDDRLAGDFFTDAVGLSLYLRGSQSPFLARGMGVLEHVAESRPDTLLGARVAEAVAASVGRPFFRVADTDGQPRMTEAHAADPEEALKLTAPAAEVYRSGDHHLNLDYHRIVRRRARALTALGNEAGAAEELRALRAVLEQRGVNQTVLDEIAGEEETLGA